MPDERFAIASDHAGVGLKAVLRAELEEAGRVVIDLGPRGDGPVDYPDFAQALAREIESGRADRGVLICGSGIGMSIAVNRSRAVRGALCRDEEEARLAARSQRCQCARPRRSPRFGGHRASLPAGVSGHRLRGRPPQRACGQALLTRAGRGRDSFMAVSTSPEGGAGTSFFTSSLRDTDAAVHAAVSGEVERLQTTIELIASENIVSRAVLEAQGSVLTNKYAEGYPGRRYYGGCENVDIAEGLAIERAVALFGCGFANVQPHSGAQANQAAFLATLEPGDAFLGLSLAAGGHLTHGAPPNLSGKWFKAIQYGVRREDELIDFDEVAALADTEKPKLILAGGSAYPRIIDFARFRKIADAVGAVFMVDMAHFAGLVAAGIHPNPFPHAHIVTTTTHKTLRGPRGGMILTDDEALAKRINSAVFPGLQGGPLEHVIAAKAVALGEAMTPAFKDYARQVVANAKALAGALVERGYDIVSGGTDTHLLLVDLRAKGLTGKLAEAVLEHAGITCNKNGVPFDPQKPWITSGIRLGSPAATSRGFGTAEFRRIAGWIADLLDHEAGAPGSGETLAAEIREDVRTLCAAFPVYPGHD